MKKLRFVIFVMLIMLLLCSAARAVRSAPEALPMIFVSTVHPNISAAPFKLLMARPETVRSISVVSPRVSSWRPARSATTFRPVPPEMVPKFRLAAPGEAGQPVLRAGGAGQAARND